MSILIHEYQVLYLGVHYHKNASKWRSETFINESFNKNDVNTIRIDYREILKKSDYILCEDTRVSRKLLSHFNINGNLLSNHRATP